jgi:hypothetical protein
MPASIERKTPSKPYPLGVISLTGLLRIRSVAEQVADHLRCEMMSGRWKETIPDIHQLADELGVNHKTVKTDLGFVEMTSCSDSRLRPC